VERFFPANPIERIYNTRLTQILLLDYLKEKEIPSYSQLAQRLDDIKLVEFKDGSGNSTAGMLDLVLPISAQKPIEFDYREASSAATINRLFGRVYSDLDVLYDAAVELETGHARELARSLKKLRAYEKRVQRATESVNRLLLLSEDTEGLLAVVGDNFLDDKKIDLAGTDARVDIDSGMVFAGTATTEYTDSIAPPGRAVRREAISVTVMARGGINGGSEREGAGRENILTGDETPWVYTVTASEPGDAAVQAVVDFQALGDRRSGDVTVNKIVVTPYITTNPVLILLQYSMDGETWSDIPVEEPLRRIGRASGFIFPERTFRYLKLYVSKDSYDREVDGTYFYDFGIRSIETDYIKSAYREESTLLSLGLFPKDKDGNAKVFTKATLSNVCEVVVEDTEIEYYISFLVPSGDSHTETNSQRIWPLNKADPNRPMIAELGSLASTLTSCGLAVPANRTDLFRESGDGRNRLVYTANTLYELPAQYSSLKIWRNIGDRDRYYVITQPDGWTAEDGWLFENGFYTTYVNVSNETGTVIDFGPSLWVDDMEVSGTVRLGRGVHKVKIKDENWYSLKGLTQVEAFDVPSQKFTGRTVKFGADGLGAAAQNSAGAMEVFDPLYPHNQKLLIEGLTYNEDYTGLRVYRGVEKFSAHLMSEVSEFEFFGGIPPLNYTRFAKLTVQVGNTQKNGIVIKWDNSLASQREAIQIETTTSAGSFAEGLKFKAVLKTRNPKHSPSLDGYQIKVVE